MPKKEMTTIYLLPEQMTRLKRMKKKTRVPKAEMIRQAIDEWLHRHEILDGMIDFQNCMPKLRKCVDKKCIFTCTKDRIERERGVLLELELIGDKLEIFIDFPFTEEVDGYQIREPVVAIHILQNKGGKVQRLSTSEWEIIIK